jgi:hypothetical protein
MATEYPPLGKSYVISYANNDRDYPIIGIRKDPRVDNYKIPNDLSPHPDSVRYPNHVFTGANPTNSDERVLWVYEILPSPWVPFTRYDDDLGPVQGRRRSVKNEGQQASLGSSTKISYEGREGSAIVSNEIEETWSIKVDEDGNSLFPVKVRDFYDPSRGAVEESRQLFVPTGEEVATLENINGVITQTSYEPYNEYLSYKVVQTYAVDGPELIGKTTDNDGQLVTIKTQRKASLNYVAPSPTATRTIEVSAEDAESLIERIVDTPEVFKANTFSVERPDPIPQKFRVAVPIQSSQEIVEGTAEVPTLETGEISKSEEQRNKFIKRISSTSRDQAVLPKTLLGKTTDNDRQEVTVTETLQFGNTSETPTATTTVESEDLGDGNFVIRKTEIPEIFSAKQFSKEGIDLTPQKFRNAIPALTIEETKEGDAEEPDIDSASGEIAKTERQLNKFVKRTTTISRPIPSTETLTGALFTTEMGGGIASVEETFPYTESTPTSVEFGTVSDEIEDIGNGQKLRRTVKLKPKSSSIEFGDDEPPITARSLPLLRGQEYDESLDLVIPFQQVVVPPQNTDLSTGQRRRVTPRDLAHSTVIKYDVEDVESSLDSYYWQVPDMIDVVLPDKLISVFLTSNISSADGNGSGTGDTYYYKYESSRSARGQISYDIEQGFRGTIEANRAIFFLQKDQCSVQSVLDKINSNSDLNVQLWPNARPQSHIVTTFGQKITTANSKSVSFDSVSTAEDKSIDSYVDVTQIPATIHGKLTIEGIEGGASDASIEINPSTLEATEPYSVFPTGNFVYRINSSPYKFSYARIEAIIVKITEEYV